MADRSTDLAVLVYNLGVVVSGVVITLQLYPVDRWALAVVVGILGVFWTAYFRFSMLSKITPTDDSESDS